MVYNWLVPVHARLRCRLRSWLFPATCLLCGADAGDLELCRGCLADLPRPGPCCPGCARPLGPGPVGLCGSCQTRPAPFERTLAPGPYAPPLDHLVRRLKFAGELPAARALAGLLAGAAARERPLPQWLVPVPLHRERLRRRGFNQALEIARLVGRRLAIPVAADACRRVRPTAAQSGLAAGERRANVRGAFTAARPLRARHVAVVDDVMTSGHTAAEMARALRRAGVERVDIWVCARAGGPPARLRRDGRAPMPLPGSGEARRRR